MITRLHIQPAPGLVVRRPTPPYAPIPEDGCSVSADSYWLRKLAQGEVVEVKPKPAAKPKAQKVDK